ncbi:cuticle collagen 2-like [Phaenicophaeus curvirostris]|uniref:cuticle collagen 2-like n=1 Tax=Phaenicophaeus curvirostris TaxID=33595 RepID=UPI0037F0F57E
MAAANEHWLRAAQKVLSSFPPPRCCGRSSTWPPRASGCPPGGALGGSGGAVGPPAPPPRPPAPPALPAPAAAAAAGPAPRGGPRNPAGRQAVGGGGGAAGGAGGPGPRPQTRGFHPKTWRDPKTWKIQPKSGAEGAALEGQEAPAPPAAPPAGSERGHAGAEGEAAAAGGTEDPKIPSFHPKKGCKKMGKGPQNPLFSPQT